MKRLLVLATSVQLLRVHNIATHALSTETYASQKFASNHRHRHLPTSHPAAFALNARSNNHHDSNKRGRIPLMASHHDEILDSSSSANANNASTLASTPLAFIHEPSTPKSQKLRSRLLKSLRDVSLRYSMIEPNDRIMICISGGKDSATLLHLFLHLQKKLSKINTNFELVAVHLNQVQPGYDNTSLVAWLESLKVPYRIVTEDTYSIVTEKTPEGKAYCSMCSRLRRGILYTIAHELECNKIALGHHGDDAMETLLLNMVHGGTTKGMPARYYSETRDVHMIRPLITCLEKDIAAFAKEMAFPILPCNLCGSQEDLHRGKAKLLCDAMETMNPNARKNVITAMGNIKPSHLLDENLRVACGLDGTTGSVVDDDRALLIGEKKIDTTTRKEPDGNIEASERSFEKNNGLEMHTPSSFIENLL
mmetsp:Transcript_21488/g.36914  ORF Transcript_21488/g.36914 Transcript_21488/m.36914 type:complete len:423 (-) Transcript_21488:199-1467(-)